MPLFLKAFVFSLWTCMHACICANAGKANDVVGKKETTNMIFVLKNFIYGDSENLISWVIWHFTQSEDASKVKWFDILQALVQEMRNTLGKLEKVR